MALLLRTAQFVTLALLFLSCSKSTEKNSPPTVTCTPASFSDVFLGTISYTHYYSYDDKGRVTRVDYDTKPSATYESYTFSPDKIVVNGTALSNGPEVYELDGNGRVAKNGTATFTYNSEGYLTQFFETQGPHSTTITYSYQNSNLVRLDQTLAIAGAAPAITTVLFEYDEMLAPHSLPQGIPLRDLETTRPVLSTFFGKHSKNMVKKETVKTTRMPDVTRIHTYTKDDKGNITVVNTNASDGRSGEKHFIYNCQ